MLIDYKNPENIKDLSFYENQFKEFENEITLIEKEMEELRDSFIVDNFSPEIVMYITVDTKYALSDLLIKINIDNKFEHYEFSENKGITKGFSLVSNLDSKLFDIFHEDISHILKNLNIFYKEYVRLKLKIIELSKIINSKEDHLYLVANKSFFFTFQEIFKWNKDVNPVKTREDVLNLLAKYGNNAHNNSKILFFLNTEFYSSGYQDDKVLMLSFVFDSVEIVNIGNNEVYKYNHKELKTLEDLIDCINNNALCLGDKVLTSCKGLPFDIGDSPFPYQEYNSNEYREVFKTFYSVNNF